MMLRTVKSIANVTGLCMFMIDPLPDEEKTNVVDSMLKQTQSTRHVSLDNVQGAARVRKDEVQ